MREYDLYLPLHYNDGRPLPDDLIARVKSELVYQFGGLTLFPQQNEGLWKLGGRTFWDRIIIIRILAAEHTSARAYFARLKSWLRAELAQEEILVVERRVKCLNDSVC